MLKNEILKLAGPNRRKDFWNLSRNLSYKSRRMVNSMCKKKGDQMNFEWNFPPKDFDYEYQIIVFFDKKTWAGNTQSIIILNPCHWNKEFYIEPFKSEYENFPNRCPGYFVWKICFVQWSKPVLNIREFLHAHTQGEPRNAQFTGRFPSNPSPSPRVIYGLMRTIAHFV